MDVILEASGDGLDFPVTAAVVGMDQGINTAISLSLFGGNDQGDWWGGFTSHTQRAIADRSPIPVNLKYIKAAVELDLDWLPGAKVDVKLVALGKIQINVNGVIISKNWGQA